MKKILITRRLLKLSEDKASKIFDVKLNSNDELYSQTKLIELSNGCDGILTSITDKIDEETINRHKTWNFRNGKDWKISCKTCKSIWHDHSLP